MARRKRKTPELVDLGTPELQNHHEIVMDTGIKRARNITQTQIDRLFVTDKITLRQRNAANEFYACFRACNMETSVTASYGTRIGGASHDIPERVARARSRWRKANEEMGKYVAPIVRAVAVFDESPFDASEEAGCQRRSALDILRIGLHTLADHYGLPMD
jgi:hypothetical protein